MHARIRLAACLVAPLLAVGAVGEITIGPGPWIGTDSAGNVFHEQFQDWTHGDCRALDGAGATVGGRYNFNDGYDDGRDLIAFYSRDENDNYYLRADFYDLALGAESGNLDLYVAIDCAAGGAAWLPDYTDVQVDPAHAWEVCICLYDSVNYKVYDHTWAVLDENANPTGRFLGAHYHAELDSVEFGLTRQTLLDHGWDGSRTVHFTVITTKDFGEIDGGYGSTSDATDTFYDDGRGFDDGVINGAIASDSTTGRAKYASIAHGNQSINQADDLRVHIFDPPTVNKTGFIRTLETHEIFGVPLNIHMSGSLIVAARWAVAAPGDDPRTDGPTFLDRVADHVDRYQTGEQHGALIGGVYAEHIMPYFEGLVNTRSMDHFWTLALINFNESPLTMKVMHTPERVIRSDSTGLAPLTGHTFADIESSPYTATYLDEVTHLHWWFYQGDPWSGYNGTYDAPHQHKIHKINGVYCFAINDREDQAKFGPHDGGLHLDTRFTLLDKAAHPDQAQITVIFDDWEALAGKSFDPGQGQSVENNNQHLYQQTIRWAANHPWIELVRLRDLLDRATDTGAPQYDPSWVIDHGYQYDRNLQTYEWLKHAAEGSYHYWYYNENAGFGGNEQSFYDLVPVLRGEQGDYHRRFPGNQPWDDASANALDAAAGAVFLPSGKPHGDLNTPGTLLHDAWADVLAAPNNKLRQIAELAYINLIYETAWHEEDNGATWQYQGTNYGNPWPDPDTTWDGVNTWALRLQNHVRSVSIVAAAAHWAEEVATGLRGPMTLAYAADLDHDGQDEYVLCNNRVWVCFERWGGRLIHGFALNADFGAFDEVQVLGAPLANPSAPGEEEYTGPAANRCSTFKDMHASYVDAEYTVVLDGDALRCTAPDGLVEKRIELRDGSATLQASYINATGGDLHVRTGAAPDVRDLTRTGRDFLAAATTADYHEVRYVSGERSGDAFVRVYFGSAAHNPAPADAGHENRNLPFTEQIEVYGGGAFDFAVQLTTSMNDIDRDADVDAADLHALAGCMMGPGLPPARPCPAYTPLVDWDLDFDLDLHDFAGCQRLVTGSLDG